MDDDPAAGVDDEEEEEGAFVALILAISLLKVAERSESPLHMDERKKHHLSMR